MKYKEKHRLLSEYQQAAEHLEACLLVLQHTLKLFSPATDKRLQQRTEEARVQAARALLALEAYLGMCRC